MSYNITGKFPSTLGKGVLSETASGALMYYVMVAPNERTDVPETRGAICLVKKDGEMMTKNVQNLIKILGGQWDGKDIAALEAIDPTGIQVVAEYADTLPKTRDDGSEITYTEVKNIYPPSGGGLGLPESVDAKSVSAKYGSKFRAVFGGTSKPSTAPSVKPSAPVATKPAPPPKSAPPPRQPDAAQSSLAECWDAFYAKCQADGMKDKAIEKKWLDDTAAFGIDQATATTEQWGV